MKETCGIFIYCLDRDRLLICHSTSSGKMYSIPKGMRDETDSSQLDAAIRELKEETNIEFEELNTKGEILELPPVVYKSKKKILYSFLVVVENFLADDLRCTSFFKDKKGVERPEIDYFKWITLKDAATMLPLSQIELIPLIQEKINNIKTIQK